VVLVLSGECALSWRFRNKRWEQSRFAGCLRACLFRLLPTENPPVKTNPVKEKLRRGEPSFGTWLSLGDLYATRVMARLGFDWLGSHDYIKRVLDAGAWGIVVPMVNTPEQARVAVAAAKYPPVGNRSLGGGMHSMNFDATAGEYYAGANDQILVVLQTESPQGIQNAEAIYSTPGVDAIFVGPVDLRANMRKPDGTEATDEEFEAALQQVIDTGRKVGTPTGMHVMDAQTALRRAEQGMQFIAVGSELRMMTVEAQRTLAELTGRTGQDVARY